eukprot:5256825-Prymnesium_polylepis.1
MRRIVEQPDEASAKGAAARAFVGSHYSQRAVADLLIDRLRRLEPTLASREEERTAKRASAKAGGKGKENAASRHEAYMAKLRASLPPPVVPLSKVPPSPPIPAK